MLELKNIYFFKDNKQILTDVSLNIDNQKFVAITGPNGSGKSTLAKIIMGDNLDNYTVAIGLQKMLSNDFINTYYKQFLAGSVVVAVPITLLFLKMQKYYVEGVTAGGVKG